MSLIVGRRKRRSITSSWKLRLFGLIGFLRQVGTRELVGQVEQGQGSVIDSILLQFMQTYSKNTQTLKF